MRQFYHKRCSLACFTFYFQRAIVAFGDNSIAQTQPQSRALARGFGGKKKAEIFWVKYLAEFLRRCRKQKLPNPQRGLFRLPFALLATRPSVTKSPKTATIISSGFVELSNRK